MIIHSFMTMCIQNKKTWLSQGCSAMFLLTIPPLGGGEPLRGDGVKSCSSTIHHDRRFCSISFLSNTSTRPLKHWLWFPICVRSLRASVFRKDRWDANTRRKRLIQRGNLRLDIFGISLLNTLCSIQVLRIRIISPARVESNVERVPGRRGHSYDCDAGKPRMDRGCAASTRWRR